MPNIDITKPASGSRLVQAAGRSLLVGQPPEVLKGLKLSGQEHFDGKNYIHAFFDTIIDTKDSYTGGGTDRYLSEDYMFCQMWRKIGGKIWLCPWMKTHHIGTYAFTGDMGAVAKYTGKL